MAISLMLLDVVRGGLAGFIGESAFRRFLVASLPASMVVCASSGVSKVKGVAGWRVWGASISAVDANDVEIP
ncbi:hypothetical protein ACFU7T_17260 [Streptomyces sp. NPDC057555]|uniref:hypothetical protein n=1 Tax=Streptomyces sp. NPDC057555 TaxID=3346166 RepID=UPI0036AC8C40